MACLEILGGFVEKGVMARLKCSYEGEGELKDQIADKNSQFSEVME